MLDQIDNFLQKGYAHFTKTNLLIEDDFNFPNVEIEEDPLLGNFTDKEYEHIINFIEHVSKIYVEPLFPTYIIKNYAVWEGVDLGSAIWHNDKNEGFDLNCLYYFNDTDETTGGQIEFKGPLGEVQIYPKQGDLIFINQDTRFQHKASRSSSQRKVASIEYKLL